MADDTVVVLNERAKELPHAITILDGLGGHILRASALLRAAINTGPEETEDEASLVGLAFDEMEAARKQYVEWAS